MTSPSGERSQVKKLIDLRTYREVLVEPFTKSITTYYLSDKNVAGYRRAESTSCLAGFSEVEETDIRIMGVKASRVRHGVRGFKMETLMSVELGCLELKDTSIHPSGSRNETIVTQLTVDEPPAELFALPADYVERSPEQLEREYRQLFPGKIFISDKAVQFSEKRYRDSRKR